MSQLIIALGIIYLALGVIFAMSPQSIRSVIDFIKVGKRCYIGAVVRLLIGGLLLWAAFSASFPWIPGIIGLLAIISGVLTFVLRLQKTYSILDWMYARTDNVLRVVAAVAILLGVLLIYSA